MTKDEAEKPAIRARMAETGERYTSARHYLLDQHRTAESSPEVPSVDGPTIPKPQAISSADAPLPPRAANPGISDDAIRRGTGKGWDEWFAVLDAWGGPEQSHSEIARYLQDGHGVEGWWAQGVTVGYERARGIRTRYQHPDGYSVSASKTYLVAVERLFAAFVDDALRDCWLQAGALRLRTCQQRRSARFDVLLPDAAGTRIEVYFTAKSEGKSSAALQHSKLPNADAIEPWRAFWKAHLERLAARLRAE